MTALLSIVKPSRPVSGVFHLENGDHLDQPTFHRKYSAMPKSFRAELIRGVVHVPSPLRVAHGDLHANLIGWLFSFRMQTPGSRVLDNTTDILGEDCEPQPDGCLIINGGQTHVNKDGYLVGPPELCVEAALSSVSYDLFEKRDDYERYGVSEYLVLIIEEQRAVWFVRPPSQDKPAPFVEMPAGSDGILRSVKFPGLWLDAPALFRGDAKRIIDVLNLGLATPEHAAFAARTLV